MIGCGITPPPAASERLTDWGGNCEVEGMSFFQVDAASLQRRGVTADQIPGLGASLGRGVLGGVAMSLAGFAPWALGGKLFRPLGEAGLYGLCALAFIVTSGLFLHRLIAGAGSLGRFYKLFGISFVAYAAAWIAGWMAWRGHSGSVAGLSAGALAMTTVLVAAFGVWSRFLPVTLALLLPVAAGYFLGGLMEGHFMATATTSVARQMAMMSWGLCFGVGFGAGLGLAYYLCQRASVPDARHQSN